MNKDSILQKFKKFVGVKFRSIDEISPDFSNAIYLINDAYIVRDSAKIKDPLVSFSAEKSILEKLEPLDVTEKILHYSGTTGFKIARYIKTSPMYSVMTNATILSFVRTIKKIHKVECSEIRTFDPLRDLYTYKNLVKEEFHISEKKENKILKSLNTDKLPKVPSQSNLEEQKIKIFENKVKLVDFRFISMNSPLFDLAYFSLTYNLTAEQNQYLLDKYFGYKNKLKYTKLIESYRKYILILKYYRNCYYYTISGDIWYLNLKNELKNIITTF